MNKFKTLSLILILLTAAGCATYYRSTNLNSLPIGISKSEFVNVYTEGMGEPPVRRAFQRQPNGEIIEVFTMSMMEPSQEVTSYWFVFKQNRLQQWGRPEDWQQISNRYEISFNPRAAVR